MNKVCPRCGMSTATSLACEYCGYRFQTEDGEVEIGVPGGLRRIPLRLKSQNPAGGWRVIGAVDVHLPANLAGWGHNP